MQNLPMIGLTTIEDVIAKSPPFLKVEDPWLPDSHRTWTHNPTDVTVCISSYKNEKRFAGSLGRIQILESIEELDVFTEALLWRPLLLDVKLALDNSQAHYLVTVNTSHPVIKSQLLKALNQARHLLQEGRNFVIKINFNSILVDWFRDYFRTQRLLHQVSSLHTTHADIVITNSRKSDDHSCCGPVTRCLLRRANPNGNVTKKQIHIQGEVKYLTWNNRSAIIKDTHEFRWHAKI